MVVICQRCGAEVNTFNKLRKWCVDCRRELINERARIRNKMKKQMKASPPRVA